MVVDTYMKVLLAGANSYIGTRLIPVLNKKGHDVVCLVRDKSHFIKTNPFADVAEVLSGDLLRRQSIEELPEEDKQIVARARKIEKFLSQPMYVAEQFTGLAGKYVKIADTVRGFKEIVEGKHDDIPEQAFYMVGTIEEVLEKNEKMTAKA